MPRYDYQCPCATVELILTVKEAQEPQVCPICLQERTKLPAAPSFILKGAGWTPKGNGAN